MIYFVIHIVSIRHCQQLMLQYILFLFIIVSGYVAVPIEMFYSSLLAVHVAVHIEMFYSSLLGVHVAVHIEMLQPSIYHC